VDEASLSAIIPSARLDFRNRRVRRAENMSFGQAIQTCLRKYTDFEGRASRSECWWFILFISLIAAGLNAVNLVTPDGVI
jgi:hypothetical protein